MAGAVPSIGGLRPLPVVGLRARLLEVVPAKVEATR